MSNATQYDLERAVEEWGRCFTTAELTQRFNVKGFSMGFVVVTDRETGETGTLDFQHSPRFYHSYRTDSD